MNYIRINDVAINMDNVNSIEKFKATRIDVHCPDTTTSLDFDSEKERDYFFEWVLKEIGIIRRLNSG